MIPGEQITPGVETDPSSENRSERIGRLQFLTMDEGPLTHLQQVEMACRCGVRWIQLRMKQATAGLFLDTAFAVKKICDDWQCTLIINDHAEIAKVVKAHGVHLGKEDMPVAAARRLLGETFIIGGTANTVTDIREHRRQGADYVGLGPYRYTATKKKLSPLLGLEGTRRILMELREEPRPFPVVAIGGITPEDLVPLLQAGVHGIAFSGLLIHASDKGEMMGSILRTVNQPLFRTSN